MTEDGELMLTITSSQKEFGSILEARNVVARLNELETLVLEAERRRDEAGMAGQEEPPTP